MATDTRRTDPQFTHGKLLEAATLLRLPVDLLADRLGLAPEPLEELSMTTYETREPSRSWVDIGPNSGSDIDVSSSSNGSHHNTDSSRAHYSMISSTCQISSQNLTQLSTSTSNAPVFWDPTASPKTLSVGDNAEEICQPSGHHSNVDRSSGNYLSVPKPRPRYGTPSSSASRGAPTSVSSQIESSVASFKQESTSTHGGSDEADDEFEVTKEEVEAAIGNAPVLGPCSKVWVLPPVCSPSKRLANYFCGPVINGFLCATENTKKEENEI